MSLRTNLVAIACLAAVAASSALASSETQSPSVTSSLDRQVRPAAPHPLDRAAAGRPVEGQGARLPDRRSPRLGRAPNTIRLRRRRELARDLVPQARHAHLRDQDDHHGRSQEHRHGARESGRRAGPARLARGGVAKDDDRCRRQESNVRAAAATGLWKIKIGSKGWLMSDPAHGGVLFDVAYLTGTKLQMRPTIETPPFQNPFSGGFCDDTDPLWNWKVVVATDRKTMSLNPVGHDRCGDRAAILQGTSDSSWLACPTGAAIVLNGYARRVVPRAGRCGRIPFPRPVRLDAKRTCHRWSFEASAGDGGNAAV